jgi:hypothetical protein
LDSKSLEELFFQVLSSVLGSSRGTLGLEDQLMGGESPIDSFSLVEICVQLEDLAVEAGFEFDWTSDSAMSHSRSIFHSVESLQTEFLRQFLESIG